MKKKCVGAGLFALMVQHLNGVEARPEFYNPMPIKNPTYDKVILITKVVGALTIGVSFLTGAFVLSKKNMTKKRKVISVLVILGVALAILGGLYLLKTLTPEFK